MEVWQNKGPFLRAGHITLCCNINFYLVAAFMSSPCHVEMILVEKDETVAKPEDERQTKKKVSQKKLKRQKMKAALSGGVD